MSLRFLLDTNIVSEPLRPRPRAAILARLQQHAAEIAIAAPVWHELWYGCRRLPQSARRNAIETYLFDVVAASMPVLPYDERAAAWHAGERARLTAAGKTPAFVDGQIAAVAATNDLTLATFNPTDYEGFDGLSIGDWAD